MSRMGCANNEIELREECVHQRFGCEVCPPACKRGGYPFARRCYEERYVNNRSTLGPKLDEKHTPGANIPQRRLRSRRRRNEPRIG